MKREIAVLCDYDNNVIGALKCKLVDEKDYNDYLARTKTLLQKKDNEIAELRKMIKDTNDLVKTLEHEIKVLKGEE